MGFEAPIEDASVFFRDQFYIQFFMSAFPDSDFSQLIETDDEEEMAANIQALIDMLSQNILMYDLEHIKGEQIVGGNPEHCINLLQLAKEISSMMNSNSNELDPNQLQDDEEEAEDDEGARQTDLYAMQQQLERDAHKRDQRREGGSDSESQYQDGQHLDSNGIVDYEHIDVELDDQHDGQQQDSNDDEADNEVSINLEDAIATAEEINKRGGLNNNYTGDDQLRMQNDSDGEEGPYGDEQEDAAQAIAGIVTDGHNKKDGFDQMREEQLQKQRMVRQTEEYGDEDSGVYDEEDDTVQDQARGDGDDDDDDDDQLQMQIHPDLIAAAHKMGVELDSEQIQELQKFIDQQNIDFDGAEQSEEEEDDVEEMQQHQQHKQRSSNKKKKQQSSSSESSKQARRKKKSDSSSQDEQAYEYLQQQQADDEADNQDDEDESHDGEGDDDDDDKLQFDVDELNDQERQLLVAYLQEEYEKNPDTFQIPKEKLQDLINAQLNRQDQAQYDPEDDGEDDDQKGEDSDPDQIAVDHLNPEQHQEMLMQANYQQAEEQQDDDDQVMDHQHHEDHELNIEGGGQQIEEDDFPTEQEMIDQQLTQEQIQQVLLLKQQQQQQHLLQQSYGEEGGDDEEVDDQPQMQQIYVQRQQKKRSQKKQGNLLAAPTGASSKYAQARSKKGMLMNKQMLGGTAESLAEANPLQRLMQAPPKARSQHRPGTGKKAKTQQRPQTAKPRQPQQSYKQFIALQSNRGAKQSHRNTQHASTQSQTVMRPVRKQSARKRPTTAKKSQMNTISHLPQEDQQQLLLQQLMAQRQEGTVLPMFDEEFLNQLSEEQLQQVIQQQQAVIQQQPVMKSGSLLPPRPNKRSRSAKRPHSSGVLTDSQQRQARNRAQIYTQNVPTISSGRRKTSKHSSQNREKKAASKTKKRRKVQPGQGILLNNFFPALESGARHKGQKPTAEEQYAAHQAAMMAHQQAEQQEQIINEVPPEEEEGESQDIVNSRIQQTNTTMQAQEQAQIQQQTMQLMQVLESLEPEQQQEFLEQLSPEQQEQLLNYQQQLQAEQQDGENENVYMVDENGQPIEQHYADDSGTAGNDGELTEEQLIELLKNADQLSLEQQTQLQQILKSRWKKEIKSQKQKQYSNIYNILTENVAKAKVRLAKLADSPTKKSSKIKEDDKETIERIARQKREYETLLRQYSHEQKARYKGREAEQRRIEKQIAREMKLKQIREKKFDEELINQQKSLMYKRNAQQVRLCQKVYQLASNLEKNKLLEEKKHFMENQNMKRTQKKMMVDGIENFYRDKINMLRERIENEKFERRIAQNAQVEALSRMKRELDFSKRKEIEKYLHLLKQEDQKYDFQSSNLNKLEQEIVRLYKK